MKVNDCKINSMYKGDDICSILLIWLYNIYFSKMLNKQDFNEYKGETRSEVILADNFWIHIPSVDLEGRDLMVEIPESVEEFTIKDKNKGYGNHPGQIL